MNTPTSEYSIPYSRDTLRVGRWTVVRDTVHNHSTELLPVTVKHTIPNASLRCGRTGPQWGDPANPTIYGDGIGLIALDDVFRVHVNAVGNSLCDLSMLMPGESSYTYNWAYCGAESYHHFAYYARTLLGGSRPHMDVFRPAWLRLGSSFTSSEINQYLGYLGATHLIMPPVDGLHGLRLLEQPLGTMKAEITRRRNVAPHIPQLMYFDFGYPQLFMGDYALQMGAIAQKLIDATGADGLYIDQSELPNASKPYTTRYDGYSGDGFTPKGSCVLLTQQYRVALIRTLLDRGYSVIANGCPQTQASTDLGIPRFTEVSSADDAASCDLYQRSVYLNYDVMHEDEANGIAYAAIRNGYNPIQPWDIDFSRTIGVPHASQ